MSVFLVFLGGAIGAVLRYCVTIFVPVSVVLWLVNGLGSFLMGVLQAYFLRKASPNWKVFLTTGVLGSFTTFSGFSAEWFSIMNHSFLLATIYLFGMTIFCIVLAFLGYLIVYKKGGKI